jgi:hypothetical protein
LSSPPCQDEEERLYAPASGADGMMDVSLVRALTSLVEQLRTKVDRLEFENAKLKNDLKVMTARQSDTERVVARLQAAETSPPRMTGGQGKAKRARTTPSAASLGWTQQFEGQTIPSVVWSSPGSAAAAAAGNRWSPLVTLLQALPSLSNYVLPDTLMAPDLQRFARASTHALSRTRPVVSL